MPTFQETIEFVKSKIGWNRKWTDDIPAYTHSIQVYEILKREWFPEYVQMAWLLHDIVEDGGVSFKELFDMWYSNDVIHLVDLATHDVSMQWDNVNFLRREKLINRLVEENNIDARAVKLADFSDNMTMAHYMSLDRFERFLLKKAPIFIYYGNKFFAWTWMYNEFMKNYFDQVQRFYNYDYVF